MLDHTRQRDLFRILLALLCFCRQMPGTCATIPLQLDPPSIVVPFGSPVSVNCSTNVTNASMGWEASQGQKDMVENVTFITWTVKSLVHWDIKPICFVNVNEQDMLSLNITVYKPPDRVSISTVGHTGPMIEGSQYELQCDVQNVAPVHLLTVNWYKGQHLVKRENFSDMNEFPVNETLTLQISPHRGDDGTQYRCEAELQLGPEGPQPPPLVKSDPLNITVHYGPEFSNCPDVVHLKEGESLAGYCNVTGKPLPHSYWQREGVPIDPAIPLNRTSSGQYKIITNRNTTKSLKVEVIYGPEISCELHYTVKENEYFRPSCTVVGYPLSEIIWYKDGNIVEFPQTMYRTDAGQYTITASNSNSAASHTMEIDVLYPPSEISELQDVQVSSGEDVVLKCSSNANPRPRYKWIYHRTSNVRAEDQDGVSLLHITRAGGDNIGKYICIAYNDLGERTQTVRVGVQGVKATCPLSISPQHVVLEYGESISVECSSKESNRNWGWKFLDSVSNESTLVINSDLFIDIVGWSGNVSCYGDFVGLGYCQKDLDITIYKRPDRVSISTVGHTGPMIEGREYELQCDIQNVAPVQLLTVNWYKGNNLVKNQSFDETTNPADKTATLKISPSRNDIKTQYHCEAKLKPAPDNSTVKSDLLNITVHYKPAITDKLPRWVPVFHDYPAVLVCEASGYPPPTIAWIFNNNRSEGGNLTVKENGVYKCIAYNSVGNDSRVVNVVMKVASCELVIKPSKLLVEYGASASVDCSTTTPSNHMGMGWEASQGAVQTRKDVQLISWKVDSLVHWDIQPICFLNTLAGRCQMKLPVTVYRLPDRVSISTVGRTGPMIEGKQYELQCDVYNVAPVHLLTVNWYKGQHLVAKTSFSDSTKTPVNQSTRFHMSLSRADDGVLYRCEAELKLSMTGAGTQASSKMASQTVHRSPV
ncbi:hemicentin-1 isoform X3 [Pangasianodon hypophthalmus]|uniref:hemicentin-1 isoform X3 n=1 Tax=Pangasianodon hypophthalmus TaxID=310915 RepID=UPI00230705CC|nr:hemicentin-1 isoform X3 [Pangasianodon hypophthalmus]